MLQRRWFYEFGMIKEDANQMTSFEAYFNYVGALINTIKSAKIKKFSKTSFHNLNYTWVFVVIGFGIKADVNFFQHSNLNFVINTWSPSAVLSSIKRLGLVGCSWCTNRYWIDECFPKISQKMRCNLLYLIINLQA